MKKIFILVLILILLGLVLVGAVYYLREEKEIIENNGGGEEEQEQKRGRSFETAIIIEADNEEEGIGKEYDWLEKNSCLDKGGPTQREEQELKENEGHLYDLLHVRCKNGEKEIYYFQIDSFFGKW